MTRTSTSLRVTLATTLLFIAFSVASAQIPNQFALASGAYASPFGALSDRESLPPVLGLALGYLYAPNRTILFGASGHWMSFPGQDDNVKPEAGDPPVRGAITVLQMTAVGRLRLLKHGFTPYLDVEAGMCYISHVDEVRPCLAAAVGVQIPLSDRFDIDARVRTSWAPIANNELRLHAVHLGFVYALRK